MTRLLLGVSLALAVLPAAAQAADAIRTAAAMAMMMRRTDSAEDKRAILGSGFDAMRDAPAPVPEQTSRRSRTRRVWLFEEDGTAPTTPPPPTADLPAPRVQERVGLAFKQALAPWKVLLDSAWGGAWTGLTEMQGWSSS